VLVDHLPSCESSIGLLRFHLQRVRFVGGITEHVFQCRDCSLHVLQQGLRNQSPSLLVKDVEPGTFSGMIRQVKQVRVREQVVSFLPKLVLLDLLSSAGGR
jgi:hypothetical protein